SILLQIKMPFFKYNKGVLPRSRRLEKLAEKNGLKHMIFNTVGDKYIGEWKKNEKNGKGQLYSVKNQQLYEGDLERNFRHGFGVLAYQLPGLKVYSLEYRGDWKNGHMNGHGLRIYRDGSFYLGHWKNSKRHGYGQMWYSDKAFYDGDWVKDVRQGLGLLVRADGNRYEGAWHADMKHGKGRFFFLDTGQMQDGVWWEDYCTFSIIFNLPFRQTSVQPVMYPVPIVCLVNAEDICVIQEWRALGGLDEPCLAEDSDDEHRFSTYSTSPSII
ncbi:hypothetical protein NQ314_004872, partial [Rhamnusium bicolor]